MCLLQLTILILKYDSSQFHAQIPREQSDICEYKEGIMETLRTRRKKVLGGRSGRHACRSVVAPTEPVIYFATLTSQFAPPPPPPKAFAMRCCTSASSVPSFCFWLEITENPQQDVPTDTRKVCLPTARTRVGTLIVTTIYLQLIQNRYMFRSFTVLQCSYQHCVQPVASDVEVVGYL